MKEFNAIFALAYGDLIRFLNDKPRGVLSLIFIIVGTHMFVKNEKNR